MTTAEIYLKTIFCCMACDGNIAPEEIELVRSLAAELPVLGTLDVENLLNTYVSAINREGTVFLREYLDDLSRENLTPEEELQIVDLAIRMIEADERVEYSEVKFFKKIRSRLSLSDEEILARHPDKEDFLLPDIDVAADPFWRESIVFTTISLS